MANYPTEGTGLLIRRRIPINSIPDAKIATIEGSGTDVLVSKSKLDQTLPPP